MGSGNWIIDNITNALNTWNSRLNDIWELLTQSPETFKGGGIWGLVLDINDALKAIGYALLVLFFLVGVIKTCGSFAEVKRPEKALKLFVRFAITRGVIAYGLELMLALFRIAQGVINSIMATSGMGAQSPIAMPDEMIQAIKDLSFLSSIPVWVVSLIGSLVIIVLSFIMLLSVYGRFFKLFMFAAIAPLPLASFAGEPSASVGKAFVRSFAGVCIQGAVIVLSCVIFTAFAASPPVVDPNASPVTLVWTYMGELIFNLLILVGMVKGADRVTREVMGL